MKGKIRKHLVLIDEIAPCTREALPDFCSIDSVTNAHPKHQIEDTILPFFFLSSLGCYFMSLLLCF